jgi:predicted TIM-barrel fold metal-dependent hydrolase
MTKLESAQVIAKNASDRAQDIDAHEMAPSHLWGTIFGEAAGQIAVLVEPLIRAGGGNDLYNPEFSEDVTELNDDNVWNVRGIKAPGAFDFSRRTDVLDVMGLERQMIFPSYGLCAVQLMQEHSMMRDAIGDTGMSTEQLAQLGRKGLKEYNDWAVRTTKIDSDRLRPVAYLAPSKTVDELMKQAHDLVDQGIRAVHINSGTPPGGVSPAHSDLDEFWALLSAHNVVCVTHIGGDGDFLNSSAWVKAAAFAPGKVVSTEIGLEPYSMATLHLSVSNLLICLTMGGVFERHPELRFGIIESGAYWLGPLAESMDMWATKVFSARLKPILSMLPSEYLARNVRVSPFNDVEPIDMYFERYPQVSDCFCYSSDYPHTEGGKDSKRKIFERLAPLGESVLEKFFVSNANLLFPV